MIALIISDRYYKLYSETSNKWYEVHFYNGVALCECAIEYKRDIKIICKHINFVLDNYKLL